jgi:hypothetical protein
MYRKKERKKEFPYKEGNVEAINCLSISTYIGGKVYRWLALVTKHFRLNVDEVTKLMSMVRSTTFRVGLAEPSLSNRSQSAHYQRKIPVYIHVPQRLKTPLSIITAPPLAVVIRGCAAAADATPPTVGMTERLCEEPKFSA